MPWAILIRPALRQHASSSLSLLLLLLSLPWFFSGCGAENASVAPEKLVFDGAAVRPVGLGHKVPLSVLATGPREVGMLGGMGDAIHIHGVTVHFRLDAASIANGATLEPESCPTDAGGYAYTTLTAGNAFGVHTITAEIRPTGVNTPLKASVQFLAGVTVLGGKQDVSSSSRGEQDLVVTLEKAPGIPYERATCDFFLMGAPRGSAVRPIQRITGEDGMTSASIHGGGKTGAGDIGIRIILPDAQDSPHDLPVLKTEFFVINSWSLFFVVGAGLAIFLLGMRMMSEGLRLVAGDKMRSVLELFTRNRLTALTVGCVVTGVIQSSSACSVMVVGFVNAGLMQLHQAISVIMGANIGTTVTAQLISFKLEQIAAPAIILGMIGMIAGKRQTTRYAFQILVGFGLIFFGLVEMSDALSALSNSRMVRDFFAGITVTPVNGVMPLGEVLWGVFIGMLVTVIVQSSSASVGMLIALLQSGLLDGQTAFPLLLGSNIGTTVTAVLACIGSNRIAKQTACAHFLFNVFGTLVMVGLLYVPWHGAPAFLHLVDLITSGDNMAGENAVRFIANAHSLFNVAIALLLLPFVSLMATLCRWLIADDASTAIQTLEPHLVGTPSIAIDQIGRNLINMIQDGRISLALGYDALRSGDRKTIEEACSKITQNEERIDRHQDAATAYIQRISQEPLTEEQSVQLPRLLHAVNDAERIGDHAEGLVRMIRQAEKRGIRFTDEMMRDIATMHGATDEMIREVCAHLMAMDQPSIALIRKSEERIDAIRKKVRKAHMDKPVDQCRDCRGDVFFLEFMTHHERVGDHLLNIAKAYMPVQ